MTIIENCDLSRAPIVSVTTLTALIGLHCESSPLAPDVAQSSARAVPTADSLGRKVNGGVL